MISLSILRKSLQDVAGKLIGTRAHIPVQFESQRRSLGRYSEIKSLPLRPAEPIMILDPDDDNFGQFIYMAGFDGLGEAPLG